MNGFVSHSYQTFTDALRAVNVSAEPAYRAVAFQSLSTSEASVHLTRLSIRDAGARTAELSECIAALPEFQILCAKGFGVGLVEVGDPTHGYENAVAICGADARFKSACLDGVAQAAHDWAPPARQKEVCEAIRVSDMKAGDNCDAITKLPGAK